MKILKTDKNNPSENVINEAIDVLAEGGIVLYPTDTVYGLGANIFNKTAVRKIYSIKNRNLSKPLSILVSDIEAIGNVAKVSKKDEKIINQYLPGPYTLLLKKSNIVPNIVNSGLDQVGVRVPDSKIPRLISEIFPITTTSANISNYDVLDTPEEILNQLNHDIDLVIDVGKLDNNKPSTILDLSFNKPKIIRK